MSLSMFLAQSAQETHRFPMENCCFMGGSFPSPQELHQYPSSLAPGSILILNDRILPDTGSLPELCQWIRNCQIKAVLLDFERPNQSIHLADTLLRQLPCPVILPEELAKDHSCPVFVSLPLPHETLKEKLAPWKGREIWLEMGFPREQLELTSQGCTAKNCSQIPPGQNFICPELHCHYQVEVREQEAVFTLWRDAGILVDFLEEAQQLGVTAWVGLFREFYPYLKKVSD